jgi:hypothetical protein
MGDTEFKYTYFNNLFIPIILIVLIFVFIFIVIVVPYDMKAYVVNTASNSVSSFLKG